MKVWVLPAVPGGPLPDVREVATLGAVRIRVSRLMDLVQAWVPVTELRTLAALPEVGRVRVPTYGVAEPPPSRPPHLPPGFGPKIPVGPVTSPPKVTLSDVTATGFHLDLTGTQPIEVIIRSGHTTILPDSAIRLSRGCGTVTLSCTVTLPAGEARSGTTVITVTAVDPDGRRDQASARISVTATKSRRGGRNGPPGTSDARGDGLDASMPLPHAEPGAMTIRCPLWVPVESCE